MHPARARTDAAFAGTFLLGILAIALCALAGWQWTRELALRREQLDLRDEANQLRQATNELSLQLDRIHDTLKQHETNRAALDIQAAADRAELSRLSNSLARLRSDRDLSTNQAAGYKEAYDRAVDQIRRQNEAVQAQNEGVASLRKLADERNDLAQRLNDQTRQLSRLQSDYNKLVADYNKLVRDSSSQPRPVDSPGSTSTKP